MVELSVCVGSACHLRGSYNVIQGMMQIMEEYGLHDKLDFKSAFCMQACDQPGVGVRFDGKVYRLTPAQVRDFMINTVIPAVK